LGIIIQDLLPLLTSGGVIAALLPSALSWADRRGLVSKRKQALDLAQQRVEFLNTWIKAQEPLCSAENFAGLRQVVSEELIQIKLQLDEVMADASATERIRKKPFIQRLLLIYFPHSVAGWVGHALFYVSLFVTIVFIYGTVSSIGQSESGIIWTDFLFFVLPPTILSFVFHRFAVQSDDKADQELAARLGQQASMANSSAQVLKS